MGPKNNPTTQTHGVTVGVLDFSIYASNSLIAMGQMNYHPVSKLRCVIDVHSYLANANCKAEQRHVQEIPTEKSKQRSENTTLLGKLILAEPQPSTVIIR
jgi:hypothetical protein